MYCASCGKENVQGAKFCPNCGASVAAGPVYASALPHRTVFRSRSDRFVAGICAGFARTYGWDLTLVRVITVLAGAIGFPFVVIAYLAAWVFMPEEPAQLPASTATTPTQG